MLPTYQERINGVTDPSTKKKGIPFTTAVGSNGGSNGKRTASILALKKFTKFKHLIDYCPGEHILSALIHALEIPAFSNPSHPG